jgi:glyoxylase-like metal-dependent hydrolase (beta-lactamase superfamily II)
LKLEAVTENIFLVNGKNKGRFPNSHSILILDKENVLIDTGCGIDTLKQLREKYRIDQVINSHTHPDHSAGNWIFKNKPIYVPEERFATSGDIFSLSERFMSRELAPNWREFVKKRMEFKNCRPTHPYNGSTTFSFGETSLKPVYTPGHTIDHYCFYERRRNILFSFDYDLTSFPWYGHRESSIPEFKKSVKILQALSPTMVISSHRGIIAERIDSEFDDYLKEIDARGEAILSILGSEKTLSQIVHCAPIYGKFPYAESLLSYWEGQMIRKHLQQFLSEGKVKRSADGTAYRLTT